MLGVNFQSAMENFHRVFIAILIREIAGCQLGIAVGVLWREFNNAFVVFVRLVEFFQFYIGVSYFVLCVDIGRIQQERRFMAFQRVVKHVHFLKCDAQVGVCGGKIDLELKRLKQNADSFLVSFGVDQGFPQMGKWARRVGSASCGFFKIGDGCVGVILFVQCVCQANASLFALCVDFDCFFINGNGFVNSI